MNTSTYLSQQWIRLGAISGIISFTLFPILLFIDLPSYLQIALAILYGILFSLSGFAIHHLMKCHEPSILTQIGALFVFISGFLFNLMLTVQLTFRGYLEHFKSQVSSQEEMDLLNWIMKTVDPIHLAIQVSNDFFTGIAMILFAIVMYSHHHFGKIWALSGGLIALVLITVKCWAFPMTPYELGFPFILGPALALWFVAVSVQCLRKVKDLQLG
ncbi:MAG: hypothetical protein AAF731_10165 [Bacteroidota bacterium]